MTLNSHPSWGYKKYISWDVQPQMPLCTRISGYVISMVECLPPDTPITQ